MIAGTLTLEDISITFASDTDCKVIFTVSDAMSGSQETKTVPQDKFLKALAIAVHNDGMPDFEKDYPDAESIMGKIRWIP